VSLLDGPELVRVERWDRDVAHKRGEVVDHLRKGERTVAREALEPIGRGEQELAQLGLEVHREPPLRWRVPAEGRNEGARAGRIGEPRWRFRLADHLHPEPFLVLVEATRQIVVLRFGEQQ
jgi:hypothetical protein